MDIERQGYWHFFFHKNKTLVSLKLDWEYLTGVAVGSGRYVYGLEIVQ